MSILLFENDILFFEHFDHFESIFDYLSILFISLTFNKVREIEKTTETHARKPHFYSVIH